MGAKEGRVLETAGYCWCRVPHCCMQLPSAFRPHLRPAVQRDGKAARHLHGLQYAGRLRQRLACRHILRMRHVGGQLRCGSTTLQVWH